MYGFQIECANHIWKSIHKRVLLDISTIFHFKITKAIFFPFHNLHIFISNWYLLNKIWCVCVIVWVIYGPIWLLVQTQFAPMRLKYIPPLRLAITYSKNFKRNGSQNFTKYIVLVHNNSPSCSNCSLYCRHIKWPVYSVFKDLLTFGMTENVWIFEG